MEGEMDQERFDRLAEEWRRDTGYLSSYRQALKHPAAQEILAAGGAVVPLILADIPHRPGLWISMLFVITGEDPGGYEPGVVAQMDAAWLRWGRERGYV
jgi:hypothetical protein